MNAESPPKRRFRWVNPALVSFLLTMFLGTVFSMGLPIFAFMPGPYSAQAEWQRMGSDAQWLYSGLLALIPLAVVASGFLRGGRWARLCNAALALLVFLITASALLWLAGLTFGRGMAH